MITNIFLGILCTVLAVGVYRYWTSIRPYDIDEIMWLKVRDKILKENYAGVEYSMLTSNSPVIIRHRKPLPLKDRHRIQKFFPSWIRVEFQEVSYEGQMVVLNGRGDLVRGPIGVIVYGPVPLSEQEKERYGWSNGRQK